MGYEGTCIVPQFPTTAWNPGLQSTCPGSAVDVIMIAPSNAPLLLSLLSDAAGTRLEKPSLTLFSDFPPWGRRSPTIGWSFSARERGVSDGNWHSGWEPEPYPCAVWVLSQSEGP